MRRVVKLVLASTSARRRELIQLFGLDFQFVSVEVDETPRVGESARELVERLSRAKAEHASRDHRDARLVIAADTVVALDGEILGKPKDLRDAERMLKQLRGREHLVYSGLCAMLAQQLEEVAEYSRDDLVKWDGRNAGISPQFRVDALLNARQWTQIAQTTVTMRDYPDAQIAAYVATGDPLDKAAAYAIQHNSFRPVASVDGCYANVMGLPLCHVYLALKKFGVQVAEPDRACQEYLNIVCPVAKEILAKWSVDGGQ